jgi:hypothetical protein
VGTRDTARHATAAGQVRTAARAWLNVLSAAPRSIEALIALSCLSWDAGYQDEAVLYYQRALTAGAGWDRIVTPGTCFVNAPTLHRLARVRLPGGTLLFVVPGAADVDGAVLVAIANGNVSDAIRAKYLEAIAPDREPTDVDVLLATACLNDRVGLSYLASLNFTLGINGATHAVAPTGALNECLHSLPDRYGFVTRSGVDLYLPKDLASRLFIPEQSPLPGPLPPVLP